MASLTIHDIDGDLDRRLSDEARSNKKSKNQLVKELLTSSLGMPIKGRYSDDYREFCGLWTAAERAVFESSQEDNARIDASDWRA